MSETSKASGLPQHIAFILDGNGRWANRQNKTVTDGHRKGVITIEKILNACFDRGISTVTLYAFSSENWRRAESEKKVLFTILKAFFRTRIRKVIRRGIKIKCIGDLKRFPDDIRSILKETEDISRSNKNGLIQVALSYGGRNEILRAAVKLAKDLKNNKMKASSVSEDTFSSYLDTANVNDPDFLIRTGGDLRVSNFLLWQIAYTELYVTPVLWPDFNEKELDNALNDYKKRERRFGGRPV